MKKVTEVNVPERVVKATIKKVEKTLCDICLDDGIERVAVSKCILCKRDTCNTYGKDSHTWADPEEWGDYPDRYCIRCYLLKFTGEYEKMRETVKENYYESLQQIDHEIRKKSLAK